VIAWLKAALPDRPVPMRVWRGPFRGARVVVNPRVSLRKLLGLYEHELNAWLEQALARVTRVLDVGANDGYFTFGCAAAFQRRGTAAEIVAFEPQPRHIAALRAAVDAQRASGINIEIVPALVGREERAGMTTLDALHRGNRTNTLIKIDVEGAELEVIAGAQRWLHPSNLFVIEVHRRPLLAELVQVFAARGLRLVQIDQHPLPLLGGDRRDTDNSWLVSPAHGGPPT
jgi:SAM-dependent methyltransferase